MWGRKKIAFLVDMHFDSAGLVKKEHALPEVYFSCLRHESNDCMCVSLFDIFVSLFFKHVASSVSSPWFSLVLKLDALVDVTTSQTESWNTAKTEFQTCQITSLRHFGNRDAGDHC